MGSEETVSKVLRVHVQIPAQNHQVCSTGRVAKEAIRYEFPKVCDLFSLEHSYKTHFLLPDKLQQFPGLHYSMG